MTKKKIIFYIIFFTVFILLGLFLFYFKKEIGRILTPFFMALIMAYLINPLVQRLERRKIPRKAGILIVYTFFLLLVAAVIIFIMPEIFDNIKDLMNTLPDITAQFQGVLNEIISHIRMSKWSEGIKATMFREIQNATAVIQNYTMDTLKKFLTSMVGVFTILLNLILAMIIAYYFIKDSEFFKKSVFSITPFKWRNGITSAGREIDSVLANFIRGQLLTAAIVGVLEIIGLALVNVKYPLVLGLIGGLANIIPYFGPVIGSIPAIAVALIQSPTKAVWVVLVFITVQQIDNIFISPKIIEGRLGLHPVSTIFAVLIGGEFFGIVGMLVSVPVMAVLKIIFKKIVSRIV